MLGGGGAGQVSASRRSTRGAGSGGGGRGKPRRAATPAKPTKLTKPAKPAKAAVAKGGSAGTHTRGRPSPTTRKAGAARVEGPRRRAERGLGGEQVEGRQAVRELLIAGRRRVREVLVASDADDIGPLQDIVELASSEGVPVREVTRRRLAAEARTEAPQGVIARAAPLVDVDLDELVVPRAGRSPFLLAVDGVTDPGNLGALLRSAECAGVTGVVLPRHRTVHVTPMVTKAAAGAVEHLPMALVGGLPTAILRLRELGVWVLGLDAAGDRSLFDLPIGDEPVCLVLGSEGAGLSRLVRQRCDLVVSIPLLGNLASLNVAAAGALACYEVARRRLASA